MSDRDKRIGILIHTQAELDALVAARDQLAKVALLFENGGTVNEGLADTIKSFEDAMREDAESEARCFGTAGETAAKIIRAIIESKDPVSMVNTFLSVWAWSSLMPRVERINRKQK